MEIREFRIGDEPALHAVFYSAVHLVAAYDYTPEQIAAWAIPVVDPRRWADRMRGIRPFVAEDAGVIVGYADVQENGYIDHFFVSGHHPGRGIGRALMERIHQRAAALDLASLFSHVSRTAQPFFAHFHFQLIEHRTEVVEGVAMSNALMRKVLSPGDSGPLAR